MLTIKEAAERAGVHVESVRRWIRQGKLPAALPARKKGYMIKEEDLEEFLKTKEEVKQRGKVEAEKVLRALAQAWEKTCESGYVDIAYQIGEMSDLLKECRQKWDDDNEIGSEAKEERRIKISNIKKNPNSKYLQNEQERLKRSEGELLLEEYGAKRNCCRR